MWSAARTTIAFASYRIPAVFIPTTPGTNRSSPGASSLSDPKLATSTAATFIRAAAMFIPLNAVPSAPIIQLTSTTPTHP